MFSEGIEMEHWLKMVLIMRPSFFRIMSVLKKKIGLEFFAALQPENIWVEVLLRFPQDVGELRVCKGGRRKKNDIVHSMRCFALYGAICTI